MISFNYKAILPYVCLAAMFFLVFYLTYNLRGWAANADQEITIGYNALLLNSGMPYEMTNHPGFFAAFFAAVAIKITNSYGATILYGLSDLNGSNDLLGSLLDLAIIARFVAATSILIIVFLAYNIFYKILKSEVTALLMAVCFAMTSGNSFHFFQLRSEPLSFLFIAVSVIGFISSLKERHEILSSIYLFLSLFFYWLSAVSKIQILLYPWLYYGWILIYLYSRKAIISGVDKVAGSSWKGLAWAAVTCALVYSAIYKFSSGASAWLHAADYTILLLIFSLCGISKNHGYVSYPSVCYFNVIFLLSGVTAYILVMIISVNPGSIFNVIGNPIQTLSRYASNPLGYKIITSNSISLKSVIPEVKKSIWTPLRQLRGDGYGVSIRYGSEYILILASIVLFSVAVNVSCRERLLILYSLLAFGIISFINGMRYLAPHYIIYNECFLFAIVVLLLSRVKGKYSQLSGALVIILVLLMWRAPEYQAYYQDKQGAAAKQCVAAVKGGSFMFSWHKHLDHSRFIEACHKSGYI